MTLDLGKLKNTEGDLDQLYRMYGVDTVEGLYEAVKLKANQLRESGDTNATAPNFRGSIFVQKYGRNPTFVFNIDFIDGQSPETIEIAAPSVWNATLKIRFSMLTNRTLRDKISNNVNSVFVHVQGYESETRKAVSVSLIDYKKEKPEVLSAQFINSEFPDEVDQYGGRDPHTNNFERIFNRTGTTRVT